MEPKFELPKTPQNSPQNTHETGSDAFAFLDKTGVLELRKSDEKFESWLQGLSYQEYENYIIRLNGLLRKKATSDRSVDGKNVEITASMAMLELTAYLPPYPDQKEGLIQETFDTLKEIKNNDDRAHLAYYTMGAIHPFSDGNGRTGRLLYTLLSEKGKNITSEDLSTLLDHDTSGHQGTGEGRKLFAKEVMEPESAYYYVNRDVAKEMLGEDFLNTYGSIYIAAESGTGTVPSNIEIPQQDRVRAEKILGESDVPDFSFRAMLMAKLLQHNGKTGDYVYETARTIDTKKGVVPEDVGKKFFNIDGEKLMNELTIDDVKYLLETHREMKKKFVETLIDAYKNPSSHTVSNGQGEKVQIKDIFRLG